MGNPGNINGSNGQSGGLQYVDIASATYTLSENDAGKTLRVSVACTITLPADGPAEGFFCSVRQTGAGAVAFAGGGGVTVNSSAGVTPSVAAQWTSAVVTRDSTYWIVEGSIV